MSVPVWLTEAVVPLAWCWRIERADGVTIGLTTHDRRLRIAGLDYQPEPGIRPSAIEQRRGIGGTTMDVEGALSSAAIAEDDLAQGRWDGARLTLIVADWQDAGARWLVVAEGALGAVTSDGRGFSAALSGKLPELALPVAPETSAECRAELGDRDCRVALAAHQRVARVTAVDGHAVTVDAALAEGDYLFGRLRWIDGAMRGTSAAIIAQAGGVLTLARSADRAVAGERVALIAGCDKRLATCATRFANAENFRGEPHLPGIDLLTRFPGG
jgi:uncharacterized phage protein (TIGR02218 family)